jgi:RHS repeat-associated protein
MASGAWFGRPLSELRPDGTLTTYAYVLGANTLTTTTEVGQADGTGTSVTAGTRTVLVETLVGKMVSQDVYDIATNSLLTSQLTTQTDSLGRPTRIDFQDGTYELRSYACCGLDMLTDRQGIATNFEYNALGQVDRESRAGIATNHNLDPDGRLISNQRIGSDNSVITTETHHYDLAGRQDWSRDALNRQTSFSEVIDGSGHTVRTTTNPDGGTIVRTYATDGTLLSVNGTAAPQKLAYEYGVDADGAFTKEIHVSNSGETTEWVKTYSDFAGRSYKRIFADGATEMSYFNSLGQLIRQVDPDGVATLFAYNGKGEQETTAIDVNGNGVIDYAGTDRITRTVADFSTHGPYTVQRTTTQSWETDGQDTPTTVALAETTPDGMHSWQTVRGLTTTVVTTFTGSGGRTVVSTAPDGTVTTQSFLNDRLSSVVTSHPSLGSLSSTSYTYDPHGRLQASTDARNGTTAYTYFDDDQIHTVTTPDPDTSRSGDGYDPQTTTYGYDVSGRQSSVTQPDGGVVSTTFWPAGQVRRTSGARTYPVEYSYDTQGRVKTLTTWQNFAGNAGAAVTTWNYNPQRGWLDNKRYADNTGPSYTYKPSGRLLTRVWARAITTTYGYNGAGDLTSVDYSDTTPDVTMSYDRSGRPNGTTDVAGSRAVTYDPSGQLKDEDYSGGLLGGFGVHRTFNSTARLSSVSALSGSSVLNQIGYSYDAASRMDTVTSGASTATYAYVPNSPLVGSVTFKQSGTTRLTTTKTCDLLNRLASVSSAPSASSVLSYQYSYNSANQRTRATREDSRYWDYGYDALGQVTSAAKHAAGGSTIPGKSYSYAFDDIGNRQTTTVNGNGAIYSPNSLNQYTQRTVPGVVDVAGTAVTDANVTVNNQAVQRSGEDWYGPVAANNTTLPVWANTTVVGVRPGGGPGGADAVAKGTRHAWVPKTPEAFSYDGDGNLTQDGRWVYTWDGENRLIAMETRPDILPPTGTFPLSERRKLEFAYDGHGRRISKKVSTWNGTGWVLVTSRLFMYDGWNLLAELTASNLQLTASYVWGLDLSGSLQGAGGVGGLLFASSTTLGSSLQAPCYDGNGNVIAYVDMATGTKSATFEYGAFGGTIVSDGPAAELFPFRFSTKYTDIETGLVSYIFRFYDPSRGRWLSKDPIGEDGGMNLYGMVGNNAVSQWDYLGLADVGAGRGRYDVRHPKGSCSPDKPCPENVEILKDYLRAILLRLEEDFTPTFRDLAERQVPHPNPRYRTYTESWNGHTQQVWQMLAASGKCLIILKAQLDGGKCCPPEQIQQTYGVTSKIWARSRERAPGEIAPTPFQALNNSINNEGGPIQWMINRGLIGPPRKPVPIPIPVR